MNNLSEIDGKHNTPNERKTLYFFVFAMGIVAAFTPIFMLIHEVGHLLAAGDTLTVTLKDWQHVHYKGPVNLGFLMAGWAFQFCAWLALWALAQRLSFVFLNTLFDVVAGFSWGYVHGTVIQACRSQDFLDIQEKLGVSIADTQMNWLTFTVPVVLCGWIVVRKCLKTMY